MSAAAKRNGHKVGVDALLTARGKKLKAGESVRFRLVKGSVISPNSDPVDPKAPREVFPLVAKFPESVVKPEFSQFPWKQGRLYQQNVPQPEKTLSDEEAELAAADQPVKRWKRQRRRQDAPARQWILQEQVDFLETMVNRRQQTAGNKKTSGSSASADAAASTTAADGAGKKLSSCYQGTPEHNSSHYVLFLHDPQQQQKQQQQQQQQQPNGTAAASAVIQVCSVPPPQGTVTFAQPAARRAMTLSQAEQAILDQRSGILTHNQLRADAAGTTNAADDNNNIITDQQRAAKALKMQRAMLGGGNNPANANTSKNRLLNKFRTKQKQDADEEGDDVMGDVTFRSRKGAGAARKELLTTLGDGVKVSDDGVIGGSNDADFGGRGQRFGNFKAGNNNNGGSTGRSGAKTERGADGAAMADDFYQRDVAAEYNELDFDASEQFDNDDVDVGETVAQQSGEGGFGGGADIADDDEEYDDDDEDGDQVISGAEGLASVKGFKAMLAKARGDAPATQQQQPGSEASESGDKKDAASLMNDKNDLKRKRPVSPKNSSDSQEPDDHMSKIMAAADRADREFKKRADNNNSNSNKGAGGEDGGQAAGSAATGSLSSSAGAGATTAHPQDMGIEKDADGLRVITVTAVRKEIWLNHGSIPMKRLMKIFDIKKKSTKERQEKFRQAVKELCTMKSDPVAGRMLVLKQHYSNM